MKCRKCGAEAPIGHRYCGVCGSDLTGATGLKVPDWMRDGRRPDEYYLREELPGENRLHQDDGYYYTYRWLGVKTSFKKWRWDFMVYGTLIYMVIIGFVFAAFELYFNTLLCIVFGILMAGIYHEIGVRKSGLAALFSAGIVMVICILVVSVPWQLVWAEMEEERNEPRFTAHLHYNVVNGTTVVVTGEIVNDGRTSGYAYLTVSAWAGYRPGWPDDYDISLMMDSHAYYRHSFWIQADGGSVPVHWEHTFDYWGVYGTVTWKVESTS